MVSNLDLQKAYDKVEWDFTLDTLSKVGIPPWMANAIHVHMSSTFMAINWNGIPFDSFTPMCGRRQGDPFSPYIFVLCIQRLAHLIQDSVQNGNSHPFSVG